ncbi:MAG: hypothetical protein OXG92_07585 [Chloroflexi bacterium]|nr:hypothetical protein [Chloroflexota bacterium]MDE2651319.1 hypothetical protein [Chloroflexota bacterium]MXX81876.1 hypothetical protein [Chloroflexota bacterium]MYA93202.1 hypothetical protein [Chloroflexota bacterium]MYH64156.1 hypothetical protein [Chloroflexota bacterium]
MLPAHHWAYEFVISADDIEAITNLLLEKETPLTAIELAIAIIKRRENAVRRRLKQQYADTKLYRPADSYQIGDRLTFAALDYATGQVVSLRSGTSADFSAIQVAAVQFDEAPGTREFVVELPGEHPLNNAQFNSHPSQVKADYTLEDILRDPQTTIVEQVNDSLERNPDLVRISGTWFVRELMVDVDIGHLHLAEAVLDMHGGGPLSPQQILAEVGGLGDMPLPLQAFSLNYAMNQDERFDEVGPAGQVLWHLKSLLPRMVLQVPAILQYSPLDYDRRLLPREMLQLEYDLDDEHSPLTSPVPEDEVSITLIYPHRRVGTLPINSETQHIFPDAKTPRIAITVIDLLDKEEYRCWVVHEHKYVFGLAPLYQKHHLPVGAYAYLNRTDDPARIEIEFDSYRPRTEWIPLADRSEDDRLRFRTAQRAVGADYDEMIIVGVGNLAEVDKLGKDIQTRQVPLVSLLRSLIHELSRQTPQGTVHTKVLYSALNILRRCPPGPMFATLLSSPDFDYVGGNYWKLNH